MPPCWGMLGVRTCWELCALGVVFQWACSCLSFLSGPKFSRLSKCVQGHPVMVLNFIWTWFVRFVFLWEMGWGPVGSGVPTRMCFSKPQILSQIERENDAVECCGHWTVNHIWSEKRCAHAVVFKQDTSGTLNSNWKWCFGNTVPRVSVTETWKINLQFNALKTLCSLCFAPVLWLRPTGEDGSNEPRATRGARGNGEGRWSRGREASATQYCTGWLRGLQGTCPKSWHSACCQGLVMILTTL